MSKKITIYDVAERAGVAISTVSRVLNDSPYVSDETKQKVSEAIKSLKFRPQVNARKLASKEAHIISVAVPTFTTPFYNEILKGLSDQIKFLDLDFIIYNTGSLEPKENFKKFLDRGTPDAIMLFSLEIDAEIAERLKQLDIPVILIDTRHPDFDFFAWNNYKGGFMAGEHLIKKGFERIGMIKSYGRLEISNERERGFLDALKKHNRPIREELVVSGVTKKHAGFSEEAGFEAINMLQIRGSFPDAIFCSNDTQAIGALHGLSQLGKRVPDDVALMGYDNIKISGFLNLSTIDQKMYDVGKMAVNRLAERIKQRDEEIPLQQIEIEPVLIERQSSQKLSK